MGHSNIGYCIWCGSYGPLDDDDEGCIDGCISCDDDFEDDDDWTDTED